jgi:hypothetical protein
MHRVSLAFHVVGGARFDRVVEQFQPIQQHVGLGPLVPAPNVNRAKAAPTELP